MNSNLWHIRLCHYLTKTKIHQPVESLEVVVFCLHLSNFVPLFTALFFGHSFIHSSLKVLTHSSTVILLFFQTFLTFDSRILRFLVKFTVDSMIVSCPGPMAEKQPQIATLQLLFGNQCEVFLLICCVWVLPEVLLYDQMSTLVSSVHRTLFQKRFVQMQT